MKTSTCIKTIPSATHEIQLTKLLTIRQLSEVLNVGVRALARLQSSGKMPKPVRIGGSVRHRAEVVQEWLEAGCPDCRKGWKPKGGAA